MMIQENPASTGGYISRILLPRTIDTDFDNKSTKAQKMDGQIAYAVYYSIESAFTNGNSKFTEPLPVNLPNKTYLFEAEVEFFESNRQKERSGLFGWGAFIKERERDIVFSFVPEIHFKNIMESNSSIHYAIYLHLVNEKRSEIRVPPKKTDIENYPCPEYFDSEPTASEELEYLEPRLEDIIQKPKSVQRINKTLKPRKREDMQLPIVNRRAPLTLEELWDQQRIEGKIPYLDS
jgi:hypothetical protein